VALAGVAWVLDDPPLSRILRLALTGPGAQAWNGNQPNDLGVLTPSGRGARTIDIR
jgi:hypothetical protein